MSDGMNEHDQLREVAVQLNAQERKYTALHRLVEGRGFKVIEVESENEEFVLTDGSHSPVALIPVDAEKLMTMALQAHRRERRLQDEPAAGP